MKFALFTHFYFKNEFAIGKKSNVLKKMNINLNKNKTFQWIFIKIAGNVTYISPNIHANF